MTAVEWDYTKLAGAYADRPDYAAGAVDRVLELAGVGVDDRACDVGAGSGHLTLPLLERGLLVDAVEPNDEMRALGGRRTSQWPTVSWFAGTAQDNGREAGAYRLVTFGSSFNVADPALTLPETARVLAPGGWFACLWNHRDLTDPLQAEIEDLIRARVPGYSYGARRADQAPVIAASGLFGEVREIVGAVRHSVRTDDWCQAWRSHATLARQAGDRFGLIVDAITGLVRSSVGETMIVPYTTRGWAAPVRAADAER